MDSQYFWLALIPILIKFCLWYTSRKYVWADTSWFVLLAALSFQDISELVAYSLHEDNSALELYFRTYYISLAIVVVAVYGYVCNKLSTVQKTIFAVMVLCCSMIAMDVIFYENIIVSYTQGSFPLSSTKGPYFDFYLLFGLACVAASILVIYRCIFSSNSSNVKQVGIHNLLALTPFFLVGIFIATSMLLDYEVNGSGWFPVASTLFVFTAIILRCHAVYLIEGFIPFTKINITWFTAGRTAVQTIYTNTPLHEAVAEQEKIILNGKIEVIGRNKTQIAKTLGISRQTLNRKLKKHGLHWQD